MFCDWLLYEYLRHIANAAILRLAEARSILRLRLWHHLAWHLSLHVASSWPAHSVTNMIQRGVVYWLPHILDRSLWVGRSNNLVLPV